MDSAAMPPEAPGTVVHRESASCFHSHHSELTCLTAGSVFSPSHLFVDHVVRVGGPADQLSRGEPHADLVVGRVDGVGAVHDVAARTAPANVDVRRARTLYPAEGGAALAGGLGACMSAASSHTGCFPHGSQRRLSKSLHHTERWRSCGGQRPAAWGLGWLALTGPHRCSSRRGWCPARSPAAWWRPASCGRRRPRSCPPRPWR